MTDNWQFWVVIASILFAAWRVGMRIWRSVSGSDGHGSCGSGCQKCPSASSTGDPPLVQLDISGSK